MKLREYQEKSIQAIKKAFLKGLNKLVIVLATGTGKTIIFCNLSSLLIQETGKKVLILAHREELLQQAKEKMERVNPNLRVGIEMANQHADPKDYDIIVASVPTLGRESSSRILKFNPADFCLVIIDEAHHASNTTYKTILRHFGLLKGEENSDWNKECLLLGVTATPSRNDNKGIDKVFDEVIYKYDIINAIQDGWLVRVKAYRVRTETDLTNVSKTAGDFNLGQLGEAVNNNDRNGLVIKTYKQLLDGKQALCFAVDVAHTKELSKRFQDAGITTGFVVGTTPKEERAQLLADFRDKKIQVMVNAMVLTEGYDNESIDAILMARPTQSNILFQQMIGRGTRLFENKKHLTVVDFVDNTFRQNLQTISSLLGIPGSLNFAGHDILDIKEQTDKLKDMSDRIDWSKIDIDNIKLAIEEVDILSGLKVPDEVATFTSNDWHKFDEETYRLNLANGHYIVVKLTVVENYAVSDDWYDKDAKREESLFIGSAKTLEKAIKGADVYLERKYPQELIVTRQNSKWRSLRPTDGQIALLRRLRVRDISIAQLKRGDASRLIDKLLSANRRERVIV